MKTSMYLIAAILAVAIMNGCKHEIINPTGDNTIDTLLYPGGICFERDILPIFSNNCAMSGCHDVYSNSGDYILNSYSAIISKGLKPGKAADSKLYQVLVTGDPGDRMPQQPNAPLTAGQITIIKSWINSGAPNGTGCITNCDPTVFTFSKAIKPTIDNYCSGCHNSGNTLGGYNFSNFTEIQGVALNGKLLGAVSHLSGYSAMPQGRAKLSDCKIEQISKWINAGAPNN